MEEITTQKDQVADFNIIKSKNRMPKKALFYVVCLFCFFLAFYFFFLSAPTNFPMGATVSIKYGESLRDVSRDFKEQKLIRSRTIFESFIIIYGGEKYLVVGDYLFKNKVPVFEVARRIAKKERDLAPLRVTIPEGFNNADIAETFSIKLKNFNKDKFLTEAYDKQGYLFPDTYFFFSEDNEESVLNYMEDNFNKKIKKIEPDIISSGKSEKEIITMASIIEKEARGDSDRGIISGILWNRISKKMPLQVDADLWTYKNKGLPESPVCNPGLEAINAAIQPVNSPYFYYLHDKNGIIHYAKTFEEHKKNKAKYL